MLLTAIYAINVTDQYVVPTLFPLLKEEFGLPTARSGSCRSYVIVVMVCHGARSATSPTVSRTRIISWGTAAWGATMIFTGLAWNYASLFVARMTLGAWDPCDNPTSQSLLADYYPTVQRSKVMSIYQVGQLLGVFLIPVAAAMATSGVGARRSSSSPSLRSSWRSSRRLPEPVRGQQDRIQLGSTRSR